MKLKDIKNINQRWEAARLASTEEGQKWWVDGRNDPTTPIMERDLNGAFELSETPQGAKYWIEVGQDKQPSQGDLIPNVFPVECAVWDDGMRYACERKEVSAVAYGDFYAGGRFYPNAIPACVLDADKRNGAVPYKEKKVPDFVTAKVFTDDSTLEEIFTHMLKVYKWAIENVPDEGWRDWLGEYNLETGMCWAASFRHKYTEGGMANPAYQKVNSLFGGGFLSAVGSAVGCPTPQEGLQPRIDYMEKWLAENSKKEEPSELIAPKIEFNQSGFRQLQELINTLFEKVEALEKKLNNE